MRTPSRRRRGFTLVELLVVIGIIALLVSILLPSLNKARRAAKAVQCSSNMKQIGMAMLAYANSNKGRLMPAGVIKGGKIYPEGFWWPLELVEQRYVMAPNLYRNGDATKPQLDTRSVFYCPEGRFEARLDDQGGALPRWPTEEFNFQYADGVLEQNYPVVPLPKKRADGTSVNVATWYAPVGRPMTGTNQLPGGRECSPFVLFDRPPGDAAGIDANVLNPGYTRSLSMVKKPAELVLLAESWNPNFVDQSQKANGHRARMIGGRHGAKTDGGANAWTNLAFFDGHVAIFPTERWDRAKASAGGENDTGFRNFTQETIFYLSQQKGQQTNLR